MKTTGIVRNVDNLGRLVLPSELRKTLNIELREPLEIYVEGDCIILKKYAPACIFCGSGEKVFVYHEKRVCEKCIDELRKKTV